MSRSIVLVDAFRDEREMYAEYLRATGFQVRTFIDADAAFADATADVPELLITRWRDGAHREVGLILTQRLRANPKTAAVPIIVLGTMLDEATRGAALAAGADRYMLLPCLPQELAEQIDRLAGKRRLFTRRLRGRARALKAKLKSTDALRVARNLTESYRRRRRR